MASEIFLFICNLLVPILMLFFGVKWRRNQGPKNINGIYGYRTSMSMINEETWKFAHKYCGKLWVKLGFIMLIVSVVSSLAIFLFNGNQGINVAIFIMQIIVVIAAIFPVEKALKKNFDENGNRRM